MIGKTILHYKILKKLGEGGMGVVYKAEDMKLKRTVALKFLPLDVAGDDELRKRFINEAQTASALNHPNICTIYSAEDDDQPFIAMEFVQGKELREIVGAYNYTPLPVDEIINYATQIAEGLQAAHKNSITHRDIKPANIMVTDDGLVKVMDFGLAKKKGQPALTKTGSTIGTIAYMSPEQAKNEPVDHRSDIFSFGAVLYELCSGRQPFEGDYEAATLYSVVHEEPLALPDAVPPELQRIVFKCLEKEAANRYKSAAQLLADLHQIKKAPESTQGVSQTSNLPKVLNLRKVHLAGAVLSIVILAAVWYSFFRSGESRPASERKMLVVLPFENLGPPEQAYFAAGMTEEITSRLAAVSGLGVISRSSAAQYNRTGKTMKEIAGDFGVNYVLDGTVRWNPTADGENKVRITPELIGVADDTQLWSERYDRVIDDIFVVQSEIAAQVVQKLGVTLLVDDQQIIEAKPTENLEAYDYYLRGKDYTARRANRKDAEIAVQMYEKAVDLDPNFAIAYAALSQARIWVSWVFGQIDQVPKAKEALDRARQLAPDLAETHLASGYYYYYGSRDYDRAMEHFNIVQRRQPNDAEVAAAIGFIRRRQGKWEQAAMQLEQAVELDPQNHSVLFVLFSASTTYQFLPSVFLYSYQNLFSSLNQFGSTDRLEAIFSIFCVVNFSASSKLAFCAVRGPAKTASSKLKRQG